MLYCGLAVLLPVLFAFFRKTAIFRFFLCVFRVNAVSNGQVRGDSYSEGCLGVLGI